MILTLSLTQWVQKESKMKKALRKHIIARMFHELPPRDLEDGRAT
jgi:hypothetical protein